MSQPIISLSGPTAIRAIYDQYAGMLYGYIFEVLKDRQLAERQLQIVFNDLPQHLHDVLQPGVSVFNKLQQLTRRNLNGFFDQVPGKKQNVSFDSHVPARPNRFLDRMSADEKFVFCNIHYYGKNVGTVAAEMNRPEEEIRKFLQQAFAAIREVA